MRSDIGGPLVTQRRTDWATKFRLAHKESIRPLIESAECVRAKHATFHRALDDWWATNVAALKDLLNTKHAFRLRRHFHSNIAEQLVPQCMLEVHQVLGAFVAYMDGLATEFKLVASSGWRAELLSEDEILQSQFPEVLDRIEKCRARIAKLEGILAAAEAGDEEVDVLAKSREEALKAEKKTLNTEVREVRQQVRTMRQEAGRMEKARADRREINMLRTDASDMEGEGLAKYERLQKIKAELARHASLKKELKSLKKTVREMEKERSELVAVARARVSEEMAKELILERWKRLLVEQYDGYLRQYQRDFIAAIENLWVKYAVTLKQQLAVRNREAEQVNQFLVELGYEPV